LNGSDLRAQTECESGARRGLKLEFEHLASRRRLTEDSPDVKIGP
jgi:hypothetical protein